MSLLNQVLRDLDSRDRAPGPRPSLRLAAGGSVPPVPKPLWSYRWPLITALAWLILLGVALAWWQLREASPTPTAPVTEALHAPLPTRQPEPIAPANPSAVPEPPATHATRKDAPRPAAAAAPELVPGPAVRDTPQSDATKDPENDYLPLLISKPAPAPATRTGPQRSRPAKTRTEARRPKRTLHKAPVEQPLERIRTLIGQGSLSHAEQLLREQVSAGSDDPAVHELLAGLMIQGGRTQDAITQIDESLERLQHNSKLELLRARLLAGQSETQAALDQLNRLLGREPGNTRAMRLAAGLLQQQGKTLNAAGYYRKLVALPDAIASDWLGLALSIENTDPSVAVAAYRRLLSYPGLSDQVERYAAQRLEELQ